MIRNKHIKLKAQKRIFSDGLETTITSAKILPINETCQLLITRFFIQHFHGCWRKTHCVTFTRFHSSKTEKYINFETILKVYSVNFLRIMHFSWVPHLNCQIDVLYSVLLNWTDPWVRFSKPHVAWLDRIKCGNAHNWGTRSMDLIPPTGFQPHFCIKKLAAAEKPKIPRGKIWKPFVFKIWTSKVGEKGRQNLLSRRLKTRFPTPPVDV